MKHDISTYRDGLKHIRYCVNCSVEEDQPEWLEPCKGKVVDNVVPLKVENKPVDK